MPDASRAPVLVEFVGPAGVGKTFLAHAVADALRALGVPVQELRKLPVTHSLRRRAMVLPRAALAALRARPATLRDFRKQTREIARYQLRWEDAQGRKEIFLLDEGLFHRLRAWYRCSNGLAMNELADRMVAHMPIGAAVIAVTASAGRIRAQRTARLKPGDRFDLDSIRADLRLMDECFATIAYVKQRYRPDLRLLTVDLEHETIGLAARRVAAVAVALFDQVTTGRDGAARDATVASSSVG